MDVYGAALATIIAQGISFLFSILYLKSAEKIIIDGVFLDIMNMLHIIMITYLV